ncbi:MAG: aldose 1-epimerase family protein [Bacteroidia bacterium]|nr:aldose 1-epimerase family protein [Bacteroidia bacterium]
MNKLWTNKISNHTQLGGIETSVLDNGSARGTRIAWINTGTGLRYKVVLDRAMDIADAFYGQHSLAWISHVGVTSPQPMSDGGIDWLRTFGGGLLTTCGLSHVGGPEKDSFGERGVHGLISNIPAEIESIIQPDPVNGKMDMSITGTMKETKIFGPSLELRRTISATLGEATIRIHDEVINRANTPSPHMLLYHFNFGWPLVDEGTDILWNGSWQPRFADTAKIFKEGNNFRKCPAPIESHLGTGEEVGIINPVVDGSNISTCGLYNAKLGFALSMRFNKKQLPVLVNWQHWGPGEYVTALEPSTNTLIGQSKARAQNELIQIAPGETRTYDIELKIINNEAGIKLFLNNFKP